MLDGAVVGDGCVVAAGCVIGPGKVIPPRSLVAGVPGKVIKTLTEEDEAFARSLSGARACAGAVSARAGWLDMLWEMVGHVMVL